MKIHFDCVVGGRQAGADKNHPHCMVGGGQAADGGMSGLEELEVTPQVARGDASLLLGFKSNPTIWAEDLRPSERPTPLAEGSLAGSHLRV